MLTAYGGAGVAALWLSTAFANPLEAAHPLDPLSDAEIAAVVSAVRFEGKANTEARFVSIELQEPDKATVLAWRPGQPVVRKAFAVLRRDRKVYEAVIAIGAPAAESWTEVPEAQPALSSEELTRAGGIVIADPEWHAAMGRRGYETAAPSVFCVPLTVGNFGDKREQGHRLVRVTCYDAAGTSNVWARPIEGLLALVDLDENRVVRFTDNAAAPVSRKPGDFGQRPPVQNPPRQPGKTNFTVTGNEVRWKHWAFHYRMSPRAGLIMSLLRYEDAGRERMVLYRGSLAEIFVPYMDPDEGWAFRAYLDAGEYGIGQLSRRLTAGSDCPADTVFLEAPLADDAGVGHDQGDVICLFERDTTAPLWRHAETANRTYAARPAAELVMRTIPSLGNYDYVIDWVLTEAGALRIEVGATGILETKAIRAGTMADPDAAAETRYGTLVAPNLIGVNHDHFLSFRLDVDIDGTSNALVRQRLVRELLPGSEGRRSLWRAVEEVVETEGPLVPTDGGPELWRIVNRTLTGGLGQHPGYELRLDHTALSLLDADDPPQQRAGFSAAPLWVTAYDPRQLYAAGAYPNQRRGGEGLPTYVKAGRPVADRDLVLWATIGFHHTPRPEDWPVMPTMWHGLSLFPSGFVDHNPTVE